jgi:hypothetical protein
MSAASIGKLMAGAISVPTAETQVRLWRRTYNVDDRRADVGRKLGDGTARQGKIALATIVEAAKKWFDTENKEARRPMPKPSVLMPTRRLVPPHRRSSGFSSGTCSTHSAPCSTLSTLRPASASQRTR